MAEAHRASPYTTPPSLDHDGTVQYDVPNSGAYAVPDSLDSAHDRRAGWDNSGSATVLRESPTGTPDAARLRHQPLFETRVGEGEPVAWYRRMFADLLGRHRVEYQDADGHEELKERRRMTPRPVPSDVPETRPTMRMSPQSYVFTRPFPGMGTAGALNGEHFSMADHRRNYPILGMEAPTKTRRNTYRLEPEPWDADIVDMPPDVDGINDRIVAVDVPPAGNRAWRL